MSVVYNNLMNGNEFSCVFSRCILIFDVLEYMVSSIAHIRIIRLLDIVEYVASSILRVFSVIIVIL